MSDPDGMNETLDAAASAQTQSAPNPETHRVIEGRDGTFVIPRDQAGQPLVEFFKNAQLPPDLNKAVVYQTDRGPVLAPPDPVKWDQLHTQKAAHYADKVKTQIDERGYYSRQLDTYANSLAKETGRQPQEVRAVISQQFEAKHGKSPYAYLTNMRQEQGLPLRNAQRQAQSQEQS